MGGMNIVGSVDAGTATKGRVAFDEAWLAMWDGGTRGLDGTRFGSGVGDRTQVWRH
jgi:hypothetical protein